LLQHEDDCTQLDRAAAKIVAKFSKLNFNEPLLKVSDHDNVDLCGEYITWIRLPVNKKTKHSSVVTHADGSCMIRFFCVCLFFYTIYQKPMQLGSPNVTKKCSTMSP